MRGDPKFSTMSPVTFIIRKENQKLTSENPFLPHVSKQAQERSPSNSHDTSSYFVQPGDLGQILHGVGLVLVAGGGHLCLGWKMSDS